MKKLTRILCFGIALCMLVGCTGKTASESTPASVGNSTDLGSSEENSNNVNRAETTDNDDTTDTSSEQSELESIVSDNSNTDVDEPGEKETLSTYSNEQIEFARVWLQLGPNQDIDALDVHHISAGEPINPDDDTSATYPEDVIQLTGTRLVDGSVTYSGNGDGTVNIYNVPVKWESPADVDENFMKEHTENIIETTQLVSIDPGIDEKVIDLIKLLDIQF